MQVVDRLWHVVLSNPELCGLPHLEWHLRQLSIKVWHSVALAHVVPSVRRRVTQLCYLSIWPRLLLQHRLEVLSCFRQNREYIQRGGVTTVRSWGRLWQHQVQRIPVDFLFRPFSRFLPCEFIYLGEELHLKDWGVDVWISYQHVFIWMCQSICIFELYFEILK
jgi:hypothetical protein